MGHYILINIDELVNDFELRNETGQNVFSYSN